MSIQQSSGGQHCFGEVEHRILTMLKACQVPYVQFSCQRNSSQIVGSKAVIITLRYRDTGGFPAATPWHNLQPLPHWLESGTMSFTFSFHWWPAPALQEQSYAMLIAPPFILIVLLSAAGGREYPSFYWILATVQEFHPMGPVHHSAGVKQALQVSQSSLRWNTKEP